MVAGRCSQYFSHVIPLLCGAPAFFISVRSMTIMPPIIVSLTRPCIFGSKVPGASLNGFPTLLGTMKSATSFCVQSLLCSVTFIKPFIIERMLPYIHSHEVVFFVFFGEEGGRGFVSA